MERIKYRVLSLFLCPLRKDTVSVVVGFLCFKGTIVLAFMIWLLILGHFLPIFLNQKALKASVRRNKFLNTVLALLYSLKSCSLEL